MEMSIHENHLRLKCNIGATRKVCHSQGGGTAKKLCDIGEGGFGNLQCNTQKKEVKREVDPYNQ